MCEYTFCSDNHYANNEGQTNTSQQSLLYKVQRTGKDFISREQLKYHFTYHANVYSYLAECSIKLTLHTEVTELSVTSAGFSTSCAKLSLHVNRAASPSRVNCVYKYYFKLKRRENFPLNVPTTQYR